MPELDFDFLKEKAFRLGVSHRSDIKPETLQAKIAKKELEVPDPEVIEPIEPVNTGINLYINTSNRNVFTSAGRCKPLCKIELPEAEALKIAGLDPCKG